MNGGGGGAGRAGYRALLVANSTFPNDPHNLPDLEGPRNDPALLRDALCDDRFGLFPAGAVRMVAERTMAQVLQETEDFLLGARRDDTVLLYYSGHGLLGLGGELYLCARDTRADRLRSTAVKASDLHAMIEASAAGTTVILLDCCHSGAFKGGELARALAGKGRFVMTSCRTGELANDAHGQNRASLFTHHVVEGMRGGAPDHDGDGLVGINDLYGYVHAQLTAENRQIPQRSFAGSGDVPVARRPVATTVDDQPGLELSETLIDLGPVEVGDELPPERVAVVQRGSGAPAWSVECAATWVTAVRDGNDVVLRLAPATRPGTQRANVHVRDDRTGIVKTLRITVRSVAPPAAVPASEAPSLPSPAAVPASEAPSLPSPAAVPASEAPSLSSPAAVPASEAPSLPPPAAVPASEAPSLPPPAAVPASEAPSLPPPAAVPASEAPSLSSPAAGLDEGSVVAPGPDPDHEAPEPAATSISGTLVWSGIGLGLAGLMLAATGIGFLNEIDRSLGHDGFLRHRDLGPGLGTTILGGLALLVLGLTLAATAGPVPGSGRHAARIRPTLGAAVGLATPLGLERLGMHFAWEPADFYDAWTPWFGIGPALLVLLVAVACAVELHRRHLRHGRRWAPPWSAPVAVPAAVLWGIGATVPVYDEGAGTRSWVDATNNDQVGTMLVLVVASLALGVLAAVLRCDAATGRGLLAGLGGFLLLVEGIELATLLTNEHSQGSGILWMLVPALVFIGAIDLTLRSTAART